MHSEIEAMIAKKRHAGETAKMGGARALAGIERRGAVAYLTRWTGGLGGDELKVHANADRARGYAEEISAFAAGYGARADVRIYALSLVGCVSFPGVIEAERGIA